MSHFFTQFFFLVLLVTTVNAQDSSNLRFPGLKTPGNRPLLSISNTEPVTIRLRCRASNLSKEPLFVIDGVVAEKFALKNIEPNNIESIWILKDQTATALYGYRAVWGVILITTKTANQRTIEVKDFMTGETLPAAKVEIFLNDQKRDTVHLVTNPDGKRITNKIIYGKEYELTATCVGYKPYRCIVNSKIVGENFTVLLLKESKTLRLMEKSEPIRQMCYNVKTDQSNEQISPIRSSTNQLKVFPNPAKAGRDIRIEWEQTVPGEYIIDLYNLQGQLVSSSIKTLTSEANSFTIPIPVITPGSYVLELTNKKSVEKHSKKLIIQ